jgi:hypothetical protein
MSDFLLDMEWRVCVDGYRREPDPQSQSGRERLVSNSIYHRVYRPFHKYDMLYSAFAKLRTEADVLKFINRFGPLSSTGLDIESHLYDAQTFRELLVANQNGRKAVAMAFDRRTAVKKMAEYKARVPSSQPDLNRMIEAGPEIWLGMTKLVSDPVEGIRLVIDPYSLIYGLWVQLIRKLSARIIRTCRHCGSTFEAGPGSGRRADATFCSTKHSARFHSLKRSRRV